MSGEHLSDMDRQCEFCGMQIMVYIAHECDPFIHKACKGKGCEDCKKTGKWKPDKCECELCSSK